MTASLSFAVEFGEWPGSINVFVGRTLPELLRLL